MTLESSVEVKREYTEKLNINVHADKIDGKSVSVTTQFNAFLIPAEEECEYYLKLHLSTYSYDEPYSMDWVYVLLLKIEESDDEDFDLNEFKMSLLDDSIVNHYFDRMLNHIKLVGSFSSLPSLRDWKKDLK